MVKNFDVSKVKTCSNPHLTHAQKTYLWYLAPQPSPETVPASHRVISGPPSYIAHHGFRQHLQHCVVHFAARTAPNAPAELLRARRIWRFCSGENRGISHDFTVKNCKHVFDCFLLVGGLSWFISRWKGIGSGSKHLEVNFQRFEVGWCSW